jgi:hypothetical protein
MHLACRFELTRSTMIRAVTRLVIAKERTAKSSQSWVIMRQHSARFAWRPEGQTEASFIPVNPAGDVRLGDTIRTRLRQAKGLDVDLSEFRSMAPNSR